MHSVNKILVYTEKPSPRVSYVFRHILKTLLGLDIEFSQDEKEAKNSDLPLIAYAEQSIGRGLHFPSTTLMFENEVREGEVPVRKVNAKDLPFPYESEGRALPFDLFAASFYLLSRYEEYLPFEGDILGRFQSPSSLVHQLNSVEEPLIEQWVIDLSKLLKKHFPGLEMRLPRYRFIPTYDIDVSYAYRARPLWRTGGGYLRSAAFGRFDEINRRAGVLRGKKQDPFDVYLELDQWHKELKLDPVYFFLVGKRGRFDKNLNPRHHQQTTLIRGISQKAKTGLHPSFASNEHPERLRLEKALLEDVSGFRVRRSRQHYLMLSMPVTYRRLIETGIFEDHTMGFADRVGFRAGTSIPFPFYDLEQEKETSLWIHPFAAMDGSLKDYMNLGPQEGLQKSLEIMSRTRELGGVFTTLWHNSSLSELQGWQGWREVYRTLMEESKQ